MRFLADENFDYAIILGLQREKPDLDIVRVQAVGLISTDDPIILEWAARENRILLTHDVNTVPGYAYQRVADGKSMPGVLAVHQTAPTGTVIEHLLIVLEASKPDEWEGRVQFIPMN